MLCGYTAASIVASRGLVRAWQGEDFPDTFEHTRKAAGILAPVYSTELAFGYLFRWISLQGWDLRRLVEHHGPAAPVLAFVWFGFTHPDKFGRDIKKKEDQAVFRPGTLAVSLNCVSNICEAFFVARTFHAKPNAWSLLVIQRVLGCICMSLNPIGIFITIMELCRNVYAKLKRAEWDLSKLDKEALLHLFVIIPFGGYFALILQPQYAWKHFKSLMRLVRTKSPAASIGFTPPTSAPGASSLITSSVSNSKV
jgi:hypothetical protein